MAGKPVVSMSSLHKLAFITIKGIFLIDVVLIPEWESKSESFVESLPRQPSANNGRFRWIPVSVLWQEHTTSKQKCRHTNITKIEQDLDLEKPKNGSLKFC